MVKIQLNRRNFLKFVGVQALFTAMGGCSGVPGKGLPESGNRTPGQLPNIVYILADDLGYGDVSCLNKDSKISTPNIDQVGREGMIFTDAHSGSAVCTPTRYGILTGRYCWRSRLKSGVLWGYSRHLIEPSRMTVASLLKQDGYYTGGIGKWHLGFDWGLKDGVISTNDKPAAVNDKSVDYAKPIQNGPTSLGFDYFFGIPASLDMQPYCYIHNDRAVELPTGTVKGTKGKGFYRGGPCAAGFKHEEVLPTLTQKAVEYIDNRAQDKSKKPFFLYFPLSAPHTPILPTEEFRGKSGIGPYGDFVQQCDWTVGQVMDTLKHNGMEQNTLVIITSDNGCSPSADFKELAGFGHNPSYHFRGHKADIFEGGHRIAFIARWPGRIKASSTCDDTICLTDLMATAAEIVGTKLPDNAGEDSVSILPDLLGTARKPLREATVHHSINGSFSIRQGKWKLELCPGSGGWSEPRPGSKKAKELPAIQLYDLSQDISERKNLQDKYPRVVKRLTSLLEKYAKEGRSTPGQTQPNDSPVKIFRNR